MQNICSKLIFAQHPPRNIPRLYLPLRAFYRQGEGFRLHEHDFHEVFWVEKGTCEHTIHQTTEFLSAGTLVMIRPWDRHGFLAPTRDGFTLVNIPIESSLLETIRLRYFSASSGFWGGKQPMPIHFNLGDSDQQWLQTAFQELTTQPKTLFAIDRFILNLCHRLNHASPWIAPVDPLPAWLRKACVDILKPENFSGGTKRFARLAGRCPEHVTRETRRCLGVTPTEVVNEARLQHAIQALTLSDISISQLSDSCGFQSLTHFYKLFRKKYQISPRRYRLQQQTFVRGNTPGS